MLLQLNNADYPGIR